jgi:hypothetical protein
MKTFLLIFDRRTSTVDVTVIGDETAVVEELRTAEARLTEEPWLEVVLLNAAGEEDLRKTHSRFFESVDELLEPA